MINTKKMFGKKKLARAGGLLAGGAAVGIVSKVVNQVLPENMKNEKMLAAAPGIIGFLLMDDSKESMISNIGAGMIGASGDKLAQSFGIADIMDDVDDISFEEISDDIEEDDVDIDEDIEDDIEDEDEDY